MDPEAQACGLKEYIIKFDKTVPCVRDGKPNTEEVKWEDCPVECGFCPRSKSGDRSGAKDFIPIKEVQSIKFADKALFIYEPKQLKDTILPPAPSTRVNFKIQVNSVEKAKDFLIADRLSATQISVLLDDKTKGAGSSGLPSAGGGPKKAKGIWPVKLQTPLPFIYSETFPEWVPGTPVELTVDTTASPDIGTELKTVLYAWVAKKKKYEDKMEWLNITFHNFTQKIEAPEVRQPALPTFRLFTKRAIIGTRIIAPPPATLTNVGTLVINREGEEVQPRNQPLTAKIGYKPAPNAKLSMKVYLGDKEVGSYDSLSVDGEQVELIFPNLPAPADDLPKATIKWMVTNETARVTEENTPFKTTEQVDDLVAISNPASPGTQCAGKTIDIVDNPITMASRVTLDVTAGPSLKVRLKAQSAAGVGAAYADGSCLLRVSIDSVKHKGLPYTGKVFLRFGESRTAAFESYDDDYFTQVGGSGDLVSDSIQLKCKFHLASDEEMKKLPAGTGGIRQVTVPYAARATDLKRLAVYFDEKELSDQFPDGVTPEKPLQVNLHPSRIEVKPTPLSLPGPLTDHSYKLFQSKVRAQVISASRTPVSKDEVTSLNIATYVTGNNWRLRLELKETVGGGAAPGYPAVEIPASGIDDSGNILFKKEPYYEVDYSGVISEKKERTVDERDYCLFDFQKWCWDPSTYMFKIGPDMNGPRWNLPWKTEMEAAFLVKTNEREGSAKVEIGKQVRIAAQSWDFTFYYLTKGDREHPSTTQNGFMSWGDLKTFVPRTTRRIFKRTTHTMAGGKRDVAREMAVTPAEYTEQGTTITLANAFSSFPDLTILISPDNPAVPDGSGHHGLKIGTEVWHFLKGIGKQHKWLNRDQMEEREKEPRSRSRELDIVATEFLTTGIVLDIKWIYDEGWIYKDTLDGFLKNNAKGVAAYHIDVYEP